MKKTSKRRGRNEGSIYQRKDGLWVASISCGLDQNGKRIRKNFYGVSRSEVATKLILELNYNIRNGQKYITNETLQVLMGEWLLTFKKATVSSRTFEGIISKASLYIFPVIGHYKLSEISSSAIQRLLNNLYANSYALDTVKKVKFLLRQFFDYAEDNEWLHQNPMYKIKLPPQDKNPISLTKYKAIPIEIRPIFIAHICKNQIFKTICLTMLFAGLRISEALALKWRDIDFNNKVIHINSATTTNTTFDKYGKIIKREYIVSTTKTAASVREVPIPLMLMDALEEWKQIREQRQAETSISFCALSNLVFSNNNGQLRSYHSLRSKFNKFLKNARLNKYGISFHALRHTYSSMLFESGENPKVIQLLLGHKEITTTLKIYNSIDRSYFPKAASKLENLFTEYSSKRDE